MDSVLSKHGRRLFGDILVHVLAMFSVKSCCPSQNYII